MVLHGYHPEYRKSSVSSYYHIFFSVQNSFVQNSSKENEFHKFRWFLYGIKVIDPVLFRWDIPEESTNMITIQSHANQMKNFACKENGNKQYGDLRS